MQSFRNHSRPKYGELPWSCLDSACDQSLEDIEIICIDDGSTDNSSVILQEYCEKDHRIRSIRQENAMPGGARNTGIHAASGVYIYFLDSDDILERSALETLSERMDELSLDLLQFNAVAFGDDTEKARKAAHLNRNYFRHYLSEEDVTTERELFSRLHREDKRISPVWSVMTRRNFITDNHIRFIEKILYEDEPWNFELYMRAPRAACLNKTFLYYRIHDHSITSSEITFSYVRSILTGLQKIQEILTEIQASLSPEEFNACVCRIRQLQKTAAHRYGQCSEEEKQKRYALPIEERINFEKTVVMPEELLEDIEDAELRYKKRTAMADHLSSDLDAVYRSKTYRAGKIAVALPGAVLNYTKKFSSSDKKKHADFL